MKGIILKTCTLGAIGVLLALSPVSSAEDLATSNAVSAFKRVGPQTSTTGITVDEYFQRQAGLHGWLLTQIPAGTLANPVAIALSEEELAEIDTPGPTKIGPMRVGFVKELKQPVNVACRSVGSRRTDVRCNDGGSFELTQDGGFIWARSVTSPGAAGLRVHVTGLSLPPNADLYMLDADGEAYGPFQGTGPHEDGDLWLPSVMSDTGIVMIRHFGPNGLDDLANVSMTLSDIGHIGQAFYGDQHNTESNNDLCPYNASCVQNATCQNSGPAGPAESAAAKMLWVAGCCINICTGGLIADTDNSTEIPYFLTANHCVSKNNAASNMEAFFQYQMSCGGNCPAGSFNPAPVSTKTLGSSIVSTSRSGDYSLLQLDEAPPAGSVFLGWNSAPIANTSGAALHRIHHPSGAPQAYTEHAVDTGIGTCLGTPRGEFIYSDDVFGATEGGSSGSPVVNSSGEIVGQLTGCCPVGGGNCGDVCDSNNHTIDGAFAYYFSNVESFLDPAGCEPTTASCTDGIDNDCDGDTDCDDTNGAEDCSSEPTCQGGGCSLLPSGASCSSNSECCSNKCKGPPTNKTCR